jgi:hypothetical protein
MKSKKFRKNVDKKLSTSVKPDSQSSDSPQCQMLLQNAIVHYGTIVVLSSQHDINNLTVYTCCTELIYFTRWTIELGSKHCDSPIGRQYHISYSCTSLLGTRQMNFSKGQDDTCIKA